MNIKLLIEVLVTSNTSQTTENMDIKKIEKEASAKLNKPSFSLQKIDGGLTNTSFLATHKNEKLVIRIGKSNPEILGINRKYEAISQESASKIGIAPKILYKDTSLGILVSPFIQGKQLTNKDLETKIQLQRVIKVIKKCHSTPLKKEYQICSEYKTTRTMLDTSYSLKNTDDSNEHVAKIKTTVNYIEKHFHDNKNNYQGLCHGDLCSENLIDDGKKLWLIDWEYAYWGNTLFDLASLRYGLKLNEEKMLEVLFLYFGTTWKQHYLDFKIMCILFCLRAMLWYNLRGQESKVIGEVSMLDCAKKYTQFFWKEVKKYLPEKI